MELTNTKPEKTVRYPLASAARRFFAKLLDIIFVGLIVFGLGVAILVTSPGFNKKDLLTIQPWRYGLLSSITLLIFCLYFILLPFFWKKTLFMKAFKLQYVNNLPLSNFGLNLIKHEMFIWGIITLISFVVGIVLIPLTPQNAVNLIHGISFKSGQSTNNNSPYFYVGIAFATLYIVAVIGLIAATIAMFVKNKKPAFHDNLSNVYVIHLVQTNEPDKQGNLKRNNQRKINYGVPGDISSGAFEEIDSM